jgi:hypothetical protein
VWCTEVIKIDQDENSVLVEAETADGIEKFDSSISSAGFEGPCSDERASPVIRGTCRLLQPIYIISMALSRECA